MNTAAATVLIMLSSALPQVRPIVAPDGLRSAVAQICGVTREQVELLDALDVSNTRIRIADLNADHTTGLTRVRLECVPRRACLPFYALVHGATTVLAAHSQNYQARGGVTLIRAGERARMQLGTQQMRISTSVRCLQGGPAGKRIRVRDEATKRVMTAVIVDRGFVRGVQE